MYNDMTGNFPFVSLDGSVCYFIIYHYETNSILATPNTGLTDTKKVKAYICPGPRPCLGRLIACITA